MLNRYEVFRTSELEYHHGAPYTWDVILVIVQKLPIKHQVFDQNSLNEIVIDRE